MNTAQARTAVLICDGGHAQRASARAELAHALADEVPTAALWMSENVCNSPESLQAPVRGTGAERIVLAVCERMSASDIQAHARRSGLDPFAVTTVCLASADGAQSMAIAVSEVRAALAVIEAGGSSTAHQLRVRLLTGPTTRRSLLRLPPLTYEPVAAVDAHKCVGFQRCGLCVTACPAGAISSVDGRIAIEKSACVGCGICTAACPPEALTLPTASPTLFAAQLSALLAGHADGTPGLVLACERVAPLLDDLGNSMRGQWVVAELPCTGIVTPGWLLQALAAGAPAVAMLPCDERCHPGWVDPLDDCLAFVQDVLHAVGDADASSRIRVLRTPDIGADLAASFAAPLVADPSRRVTLTEPAATVDAVLTLAEGVHSCAPISGAGSPVGVVRIEATRCTACGACAAACPTSALALKRDDGQDLLLLDPAACVGCGRCEPACPEDVVHVRRETDVAVLRRGVSVVRAEPVQECVRCGGAIASRAVVARIGAMLAEESPALVHTLTTLCANCRSFANAAL